MSHRVTFRAIRASSASFAHSTTWKESTQRAIARKVFFNALVDPSGTVTGNNLYGCPLLWRLRLSRNLEKISYPYLLLTEITVLVSWFPYDGNVLVDPYDSLSHRFRC